MAAHGHGMAHGHGATQPESLGQRLPPSRPPVRPSSRPPALLLAEQYRGDTRTSPLRRSFHPAGPQNSRRSPRAGSTRSSPTTRSGCWRQWTRRAVSASALLEVRGS